jgi:hypothetical protein
MAICHFGTLKATSCRKFVAAILKHYRHEQDAGVGHFRNLTSFSEITNQKKKEFDRFRTCRFWRACAFDSSPCNIPACLQLA